jgi:hypothetical protein
MANEFYKRLEEGSSVPSYIVQEHRTMLCGLTKHEYIALELTKAWASTRSNGHEYCDELVSTYEHMLKEVKARNL